MASGVVVWVSGERAELLARRRRQLLPALRWLLRSLEEGGAPRVEEAVLDLGKGEVPLTLVPEERVVLEKLVPLLAGVTGRRAVKAENALLLALWAWLSAGSPPP